MVLKPNTKIKLLENTKAYLPKFSNTSPSFQEKHVTVIPKYEVVLVIESLRDKLLVRNILDEEYLISSYVLYRIVGKSSSKKQSSKSEIKADLLDLAGLGLGLTRNNSSNKPKDEIPKSNKIRAVQKMQTIASNVMNTEDISSLAKLTVAALCANMSINSGIDAIQSNKLQAYCTKLIGSISN